MATMKVKNGAFLIGLSMLIAVVSIQCNETDDGAAPGGASVSAQDFVTIINAFNDDDAAAVQAVIDRGVDIHSHRFNNNETFLHAALRGGGRCKKVIKLLLTSGADVRAADSRGTTPLHWAARDCDPDVVKSLLQAGAKVDVRDSEGYTPLHAACISNAAPVVKLLVNAGADVKAKTNGGQTPADLADKNGRVDSAKMLRAINR